MRLLIVLLAIISVVASVGWAAWHMMPAPAADVMSPAAGADLAARASALRAHLARHADDGPAWKALGRTLMAAENFDEATVAYAEAARILPRDAEINVALRHLAEIAAAKRR